MLQIVETAVEGKLPATLDDLAREGARRMLMETENVPLVATENVPLSHGGGKAVGSGAVQPKAPVSAGGSVATGGRHRTRGAPRGGCGSRF